MLWLVCSTEELEFVNLLETFPEGTHFPDHLVFLEMDYFKTSNSSTFFPFLTFVTF